MVQNEYAASPTDLRRLDTNRDERNKRLMNQAALKGIKKSPINVKAHNQLKSSI